MGDKKNTVKLNIHPKNRSLYHWCLEEYDASGNRIGPDYVPFVYAVNFVGTEVTVCDRLDLERSQEGNEADEQAGQLSHEIQVRLAVESPFHAQRQLPPAKLEMFGDDEPINDIRLRVRPVPEPGLPRRCAAWGGLRFHDSELGTVDHSLEFTLEVSATEYARFEGKLSRGWANQIRFSLATMSGVYAEWSDVTKSRQLKILTTSDDHKVASGGATDIVPRRLGHVGSAKLAVNTRVALIA